MTPSPDHRNFRNALGRFATGVTIITGRDAQGRDIGLTANSFSSVSLDPPLVLWSIAKSSSQFAAFQEAAHFTIHVLAADQADLSARFSKRGSDRFEGLDHPRGAGGAMLLPGCAARFQCKTAQRHECGDHVIMIGEVIDFDASEAEPLAFHGGRIRSLAAT